MRNGFNKTLRIGLSRTGIALLQTGGWTGPGIELLCDLPWPEDEPASADLIAARLSGILAEKRCSGRLATIVLADDLARLFMVTPPFNATGVEDCRSAAEMRFQSLYGEPTTDWQLQADWHAIQPFLACALPNALVHAIYQAAKEHRLSLLQIVPQFIAAWNSWRAQLNRNAWFGVAHENTLTLGAIDQRRLCAVRAISIPSAGWQDLQWLPEQLGREALRLNLQIPQQLQLCGHLPGDGIRESAGSLSCLRLDTKRHASAGSSTSSRVTLACSGIRK